VCGPSDGCDDKNPCTIDVCSLDVCLHETSQSPVDDTDDCVDVACDGDVPTITPDDTEDAADPNPPCHTAVCKNGAPIDVFAPANTACGEAPQVCDGNGSCGGCTNDADCGEVGPCADPTCGPGGVCDPGLLPRGTFVDDETGNCKTAICTGQSAVPNVQYAPTDLPPPMTCAEGSCSPGGPQFEEANDGTPCTVAAFTGVCDGNGTGDAACVQCEAQNDCADEAAGGRCFEQAGVCGCALPGDCQGTWRNGPVCIGAVGGGACGCQVAGDCSSNMHGDVCVGQKCGCLDAGDCVGARLGSTCFAALDRCGCEDDAHCTTSMRGFQCLADGGCGCLSNADCSVGTSCSLQLQVCSG